jgi:BirA family transcriptional regulator, biotin operon repressor / biotin---[acetyl-CoA-carboxylase] ligase
MAMDHFLLNVFTSLAIYDLLSHTAGGKVSIKWPNDLLINDKKLCGILIENQIRGSQVSNSVIGIGLNVNQSVFTVSTATSLSIAAGFEFDLQNVFEALVGYLEARYLELRRGNVDLLKKEYINLMHWRHEWHQFSDHKFEFQGKITGVDEAGRLQIETENGTTRSFDIKEIKYIHERF